MEEQFICNKEELKEGSGKRYVVDGEEIVIFLLDDTVHAVSNMCPHQKFQRLHQGEFCDGVITCPMHGWSFDVRTGKSTNASGRLKTYNVNVLHNRVYIELTTT